MVLPPNVLPDAASDSWKIWYVFPQPVWQRAKMRLGSPPSSQSWLACVPGSLYPELWSIASHCHNPEGVKIMFLAKTQMEPEVADTEFGVKLIRVVVEILRSIGSRGTRAHLRTSAKSMKADLEDDSHPAKSRISRW